MARKIDKQKPAAEKASAAEELAILSPEIGINVGGRDLTIRRYGFFEELRIAQESEDFIEDLHALALSKRGLRFDRIRRLFGVHEDVIVSISAKAADVEPDFVRSLNEIDKRAFLDAWFGMHSSFFMREVMEEIREDRQLELLKQSGAMSSFASHQAALATSQRSGDAAPTS